eukprot:scaffold64304_cov77-Phaeocystis_antarctica.AAC.1
MGRLVRALFDPGTICHHPRDICICICATCQSYRPQAQADATMAASNRPMFCLSAMSATLRKCSARAVLCPYSAVLCTHAVCGYPCSAHAHATGGPRTSAVRAPRRLDLGARRPDRSQRAHLQVSPIPL